MRGGYVYIVTNKHNTVFYVGVTSELKVRVYKHKTGIGSFFTSKYKLKKLVWFEYQSSIEEAIFREKKIKKWRREWKLELIRKINSDFRDLYDEI